MKMIASILEWLFFETIYGIGLIGVVVYAIFWGVRCVVPKAPNPAFIAAPVALIGLLIIPSIPRYLFEEKAFVQIDTSPWARLVDQAKWGDITEPLTLIKTPVGFVKMVMPNGPTIGGFKEVVLRYGEDPIISIIDPDCADFTYSMSQPDAQGNFRVVTTEHEAMTDQQREVYCEYDWTKERQALVEEIRRRSSSGSE